MHPCTGNTRTRLAAGTGLRLVQGALRAWRLHLPVVWRPPRGQGPAGSPCQQHPVLGR